MSRSRVGNRGTACFAERPGQVAHVRHLHGSGWRRWRRCASPGVPIRTMWLYESVSRVRVGYSRYISACHTASRTGAGEKAGAGRTRAMGRAPRELTLRESAGPPPPPPTRRSSCTPWTKKIASTIPRRQWTSRRPPFPARPGRIQQRRIDHRPLGIGGIRRVVTSTRDTLCLMKRARRNTAGPGRLTSLDAVGYSTVAVHGRQTWQALLRHPRHVRRRTPLATHHLMT